MNDWKNYFNKHRNRKPREQLIRAVSFCVNKENALDIGAGTLVETKYLLENGFKNVVAIDDFSEAKLIAESIKDDRLDFQPVSFQDFKFPQNKFDLINAQYALPFYGQKDFSNFIKTVVDSLAVDGIFVGQFFGIKDGWNTPESDLVFNTKEEILSFFADLKVIELVEEEKDAKTASGEDKHWHVFHFIVQKN